MSGPERTRHQGALAWLRAKPILVAFAVFAMLAFTIFYFVLDTDVEWQAFVHELIPNVWVALAAFLVVNYLLYQERLDSFEGISAHLSERVAAVFDERERKRLYSDAFDPALDWNELFMSSGTVTILGRYLDRWASHLFATFVEFFARGGSLVVILPDARNNALVGIVARQSFTSGVPNTAQMRERIKGSVSKLEQAHGKAQASGSPQAAAATLTVLATDQSVNFWVVKFERHAVVGMVPHWPSDLDPPPMELFDLRTDEVMQRFLDHDLAEFARQSKPVLALPTA